MGPYLNWFFGLSHYMFYGCNATGAQLHTLTDNVAGWNGADGDHKGSLTADAGWTD